MNLIFFRHNISLKGVSGECKSATDEMTSFWNETTLPTILSNNKLQDIFKADQFGLFYQCLPDKTYHFKGEKCSRARKSKVRKTEMAAASATGEKLHEKALAVLKLLKLCHVNMFHKRRVGRTLKSSKAGFENLIGNSTWMKEKLLLSLITVQCTRPFPTFSLFFCPQTLSQFFILGPRCHYKP